MSSAKDRIDQFLKELGITATFSPFAGVMPPGDAWTALFNYANAHMQVTCTEQALAVFMGFAFLPKASIVPLFRRLLELNSTLINGCFFCVASTAEVTQLQLRSTRMMGGLDSAEFKAVLDQLLATFWQHAVPLIQEFQLPQTPSP